MATHTLGSFNETYAVMYLTQVLESQHTIKTFFSYNDKTPNYDGSMELVGADSAPRKQFVVQIKKTENLEPNVQGEHKGQYAYAMDTEFLYYMNDHVSESPGIYFVVDIAQGRIFWLYLSPENLEMLEFQGKEKVTWWFDQEHILTDVEDFTRRLEEITRERNEALEEIKYRKVRKLVWDRRISSRSGGDPGMTFDNFVAGQENRVTVDMLQAVARDPGNGICNPLYLYGLHGTGKTHALFAMKNQMHFANPQAKILYLHAETFVDDMIRAIIHGEQDLFQRTYRECDVLMLDDVQFVAGKESTQEELFRCVDALCNHGKQVVISGNSPLSRMQRLDDRLRTTFGMGICVELVPPGYDTQLEILHSFCGQMHETVPEEVLEYIAGQGLTSMRELGGIIRKLLALRKLADIPITMELAQREIRAHCVSALPDKRKIKKAVCEHYSLTEAELRSSSRKQTVVRARQVAMYLLRDMTDLSFAQIGTEFNRSHATVAEAIRKLEIQMQQDDTLEQTIQQLREHITENRK